MTDTPATPVTALQTEVSALAQKHITVSYLLVAVLVVVLGLASVGGYLAFKFADRQIARAEVSEQRFEAAQKDFQKQLADNTAQRAQDTKQQDVIVKVVDTRDATADKTINQVLSPATTPQDALTGLGSAYKGTLELSQTAVTPDGKLSFPLHAVQEFTATKIDRDRLFADRDDIKTALGLEQDKTKSLTADLTGAKGTLSDCQDTVKKYKSAAKASVFKRVVKGAGIAVLVAASFYLGHKL